MRQLTQRITARYHIASLSQVETAAYIRHRMWIAGVQRPIFSNPAINKIYHLCNGTPRLINIICDRALLGAYAKNSDTIDVKIVNQAALEILPHAKNRFFHPTKRIVAIGIILASCAVAAYTLPPWEQFNSPATEEKNVANRSTHKKSTIQPVGPEAQHSKTNNLNANNRPSAKSEKEITLSTNHKSLIVDTTLTTFKIDTNRTHKTTDNIPSATATLKELLSDKNCSNSTETAVNNLFNLWGITYLPESNRTACEVANGAGLSCIQSQGTWNNLRRYNRPAIIELQNSKGHWQHLLIKGLDGDGLLLSCGEKTALITLSEADKHWYGEYLIFWKPPRKRMRFERGNRGQDVLQFRNQIKAALNIHDTNNSNIFDAALEAQVIAFQKQHSLKPDGVAGKETIILLNTQTNNSGIPLLAATTK